MHIQEDCSLRIPDIIIVKWLNFSNNNMAFKYMTQNTISTRRKHIITLILLVIFSYGLGFILKIGSYEMLTRNAIFFITISAGFYQTGIPTVFKSNYTNIYLPKLRDISDDNMLDEIYIYYKTASTIGIVSAIVLIVSSSIKINNPFISNLVLPILTINGYCAKTIFTLLIDCLRYKDKKEEKKIIE